MRVCTASVYVVVVTGYQFFCHNIGSKLKRICNEQYIVTLVGHILQVNTVPCRSICRIGSFLTRHILYVNIFLLNLIYWFESHNPRIITLTETPCLPLHVQCIYEPLLKS